MGDQWWNHDESRCKHGQRIVPRLGLACDECEQELRDAVFDAAMAVLYEWRGNSHLAPEDRLRAVANAVDEMLEVCVKAEEVER